MEGGIFLENVEEVLKHNYVYKWEKKDREMFQEINKHEGANLYVERGKIWESNKQDTSFIRYKRVFP